ncbi:DUF3320 domain-containing protein [Arthrobacter pigmenti]
MRAWREDLLSIDRRQRLVYFQHPKTGSFEIVQPDMVRVEEMIRTGSIHLLADSEEESDLTAEELGLPAVTSDRVLRVAGKTNKQILTTCKRLHQRSEQEYADRGVWVLYVGLGMLNWVDPGDQRKVSSPLLMVPVRLTKSGPAYVLNHTEDEPFLNTALTLKMSRDFGIELPDFEDEDISVVEVARKVQQAVSGQTAWTVEPRAILMPFSFHKEAMYRDLEDNEESVIGSDLVQVLSLGPEAPNAPEFAYEPPSDEQLDTIIPPESLHSILDADGSQRRCIIAAREGKSFVMDGPPGTGKSQTIANIIAELMATGKSVLFVSEKAAALDVVRNRLSDRNLDPFLLELHSHKATRKQVVNRLHEELVKKPVAKSRFDDVERNRLSTARSQLTEYAQAMNEIRRPLGRSLHDVLGRLSQVHETENYPTGDKSALSELDAEQLAAILRLARDLAKVWRPAEEGDAFMWRGLQAGTMTVSETKNAQNSANAAAEAVRTMLNAVQFFDSMLPFVDFELSREGLQRRLEVMRILSERRTVPGSWWTADSLEELDQRAVELRTASEDRQSLITTIGRTFGDKWALRDGEMIDVLNAVVEPNHDIFATSLGDLTIAQIREAEEELSHLISALARLQQSGQELGEYFAVESAAITFAQLDSLIALGRLSQYGNLPEAHWLNPSVQGALDESARVLSGLTAMLREREQSLSAVFKPDILDLDLVGLKIRFETEHKGLKKWTKQAREDRKTLRAVTQTGTVNKEILAHLGGALSWQQAQQDLNHGEYNFSPVLGAYYQGTRTDFGRLSGAVQLARDAIRLAGQKVAPSALASQLAQGAHPDPNLLPTAEKVDEQLSICRTTVASLFNREFGEQLAMLPLDDVLSRLTKIEEHLVQSSVQRDRLLELGAAGQTLQECVGVVERVIQVDGLEAAVERNSRHDAALIGPRYEGFNSAWDELDLDREWCRRARNVFAAPLDEPAVPYVEEFQPDDHSLPGFVDTWFAAKEDLLNYFGGAQRRELEVMLEDVLASAESMLSEMAITAISDIGIWYEFIRLTESLSEYGLQETVTALETKSAPAQLVPLAIERAALEPWTEANIAADDRLSSHRADSREQLVDTFRKLDDRLIQNAFTGIVNDCAARRPRSNAGPAAIIAKEANKKSRHMPIRKLLDQTGGVVQAMKPCFMMSPLSVSQYLPTDIRFDVVIFDEASQVLPADAMNCIYRGRQLIVAGDQKQLPPTSFFASGDAESDEEDAPDDFESVLDLCKASGSLPSIPLTWHYRSRHEDLITYSNYRFYDGKLNTFPGATRVAEDLGVHHEFVQGVYRRGGDRKNPIEAERVVDRIIEHRRSNSDLSIGVVAFSQAQAEAVSEAIEQRAEAEPLLRGLMEDHDRLRGFFVKNLESVQGDERDIILFTVGYGPDEHGKLTMAFGPLTKRGGERRLNVAITRARRRVEIVSSFRAAQMTDTPSVGNRHLKNYLDFAEHGHDALAVDMSGSVGDVESPFEEEVVRTIRSWGYDAVSQVGAAGYRLDIGIPHPDEPGRFILAVECDGAAYHSAKTARDRDRLREAVLKGLGWNIHRIWGISWYRDRASQEQRLKTAIEDAIRLDRGPIEPNKSADRSALFGDELEFQELDLHAPPEWAVPYRKYIQRQRRYASEPGRPDAIPALIEYCSAVLEVEAPLHIDTLLDRLRVDWSVGRAGSQIQANVRKALSMTKVRGVRPKISPDGFVRIAGAGTIEVRKPGADGEVRKVGVIPPEEIDEAVVRTVQDALHADEEQVRLAVRNVFGWNRSGSDIQTALQKSLFRVSKSGRCIKDGAGGYVAT